MDAAYFYFDPTYLSKLSDLLVRRYQIARPFPHVVIDNFIPDDDAIRKILEEFPGPRSLDWIQYNGPAERKLASRDEAQLGPATRHLLQQFNSATFCKFLEDLTGIEGIVPDPHLWGGGLHQIERGGYLKIHTDFNWYEKLKLDRRLNVLLFLNENWEESYGGHLEFWSRDMKRCEQKILPVVNRCVVFSTTNSSYHGHPEALACPEGVTRKSMALYYYTNGRPQEEKTYSTVFKSRPGEALRVEGPGRLRRILPRLVPPIVVDLARRFRKTDSHRHQD